MNKLVLLLLIISMLFSLASCGEYNPADEAPQVSEEDLPGDNTDTEAPPSDGGHTFSATVMFGGKVFIPKAESDPDKMLKVRWTDGSKYYTVPVGTDGKAVCEGLDGDYSVTLVNLSDEYTYNPNIYKAGNDSPDVVIELLALTKGVGDGTGIYSCIEVNNPGNFRAEITEEGQIVYFQFTPSRPGIYVIESLMDVTAGMYNPLADMYYGSSQFKYPDDTIDGGGVSLGYTTNFQKTIKIAESFIGNCYTFGVRVEGRDAVYPVNVDFYIVYKGSYTYDGTEKTFMLPSYIPKNGYYDWYESYVAHLNADKLIHGNVYKDASVIIAGNHVFDASNYRLSTKDGYHLDSEGRLVKDEYDPMDQYYHVYDKVKYASSGGWGPILYAAVSVPTVPTVSPSTGGAPEPFIDTAFSKLESRGNNALTLSNSTENYKIFIEGYYNIVGANGSGSDQSTPGGDRVTGYYFCTSDCPCVATNGGACAIEDNCTRCTANCRNIPRAAIGQRGYADIAIDGYCPVTEELKEFLQKYCLKETIFNDGNGRAEQHDPRYYASHESMWLFACGYFD